jgi:hypothetical protein
VPCNRRLLVLDSQADHSNFCVQQCTQTTHFNIGQILWLVNLRVQNIALLTTKNNNLAYLAMFWRAYLPAVCSWSCRSIYPSFPARMRSAVCCCFAVCFHLKPQTLTLNSDLLMFENYSLQYVLWISLVPSIMVWRSFPTDILPIRHTDTQIQAPQLYHRLTEHFLQWIFNVIRHDNHRNRKKHCQNIGLHYFTRNVLRFNGRTQQTSQTPSALVHLLNTHSSSRYYHSATLTVLPRTSNYLCLSVCLPA